MKDTNELLSDLVAELKEEFYKQRDPSRQTTRWTQATFLKLQNLMINKGYSIGINTLREIMMLRYVVNQNPQRISTLSTCAAFLGYENWSHFVQQKKDTDIALDIIYNVVIQSSKLIMELYSTLPKIKIELLKKYFIKDTGTYDYLSKLFIGLAGTQSTVDFEAKILIHSIDVLMTSKNKAAVMTVETDTIKYTGYARNVCLYILLSNGKEWKIWGKYPFPPGDDENDIKHSLVWLNFIEKDFQYDFN